MPKTFYPNENGEDPVSVDLYNRVHDALEGVWLQLQDVHFLVFWMAVLQVMLDWSRDFDFGGDNDNQEDD